MGRYLAIGLKIKTAIGKKEISKHLDKMPLEDIFKEIEKEFIPFLEKFYQLRYQDGNNYDAPNVLEELNSIPDTPSRLAFTKKEKLPNISNGKR